jgi:ribose transport system substrate-binding protein
MFHIVQPASRSTSYFVQSVVRAFDLLRAPRFEGEVLRLRDLVARTGLHKTTVFRLLQTLEMAGAIERVGADQYRATICTLRPKRFRLGYAGKSADSGFSRDIADSLRQAASQHRIDLVEFDNRNSPTAALRSADRLIRERVRVAIEFQAHERIAPEISSKFLEAKIPLIAVEIPHPGAVFYGGNNFEAGRVSGQMLGRRARREWNGVADEVLLLELAIAGPLPHSCLTGISKGIREIVPEIDEHRIVHLDGKGEFGASLDAVRKHLRRSPRKRFLVGAINDDSALGALRAFEEAGRAKDCFVCGQNASFEARAELRKPGTRLAGSVAFFPEKYGEGLVRLAMDIVNERPVPPAIFVKHVLLTPQNVDRYYPNDVLLSPSSTNDLLMRSL